MERELHVDIDCADNHQEVYSTGKWEINRNGYQFCFEIP